MAAADDWGRRFADYDRRLRALESAPRAPQTSLRGGRITFKPTDPDMESPSITVGAGAGDDAGLAMFDADGIQFFGAGSFSGRGVVVFFAPNGGETLVVDDGIMIRPLVSCAWQQDPSAGIDALGRPTTTSASYVMLWRTYLPCLSGGVATMFAAAPGAGNTMDVRIRAEVVAGGTGSGPQTVVEQLAITVTTDINGDWAIPDAVLIPAADPIGALLVLTLEARRTAGAGAVTAAPYLPVVNWVT